MIARAVVGRRRDPPGAGAALAWAAMRFLPRRPLWRAVLGLAVVGLGVVIAGAVAPALQARQRLPSERPVHRAAHRPDDDEQHHHAPARLAAGFSWPWYGYSAARTRDFAAPADLHAPFMSAGRTTRARCWSSRRRSRTTRCSSWTTAATRRRSTCGRARSGGPGGSGRLPRRRRRSTPGRGRAHAGARRPRQLARQRAVRRAVDAQRPRALVTAAAGRQRVLADRQWADRCTSGARAAPCTRSTSPTATSAGPTRRPARSRAGRRCGTATCSSATTRAVPTRSARPTATGCGRSPPKGRASASVPASCTRPRRSPRPRLSGQHGRPDVLVRRAQRGARVGDGHRRLCVLLGGHRQPAGARPDRLRRLL